MANDAVLLVIEQLLCGPNEGAGAKLSDLNMLVGPGGRERSETEFAQLFDLAGLRLQDTVVTDTPSFILEVVRV